jgi:hypothetical protein
MSSSFLASADIVEFHMIEAYSSLDLTTVKYSINKLSMVEKEKVVVRYNNRQNVLQAFKQKLHNFHNKKRCF